MAMRSAKHVLGTEYSHALTSSLRCSAARLPPSYWGGNPDCSKKTLMRSSVPQACSLQTPRAAELAPSRLQVSSFPVQSRSVLSCPRSLIVCGTEQRDGEGQVQPHTTLSTYTLLNALTFSRVYTPPPPPPPPHLYTTSPLSFR
ncbi:uncharacterized [Tachysurus ichikawai]